MILVPVDVRPSPIHGLGLFATKPIAHGAPVARWTPGIDYRLTTAEYDVLPQGLRAFLWDFLWLGPDGWHYGTSGDSRYINHARPANLTWDEATKTSCANRNIATGEELTEDYAQFDALFASYSAQMVDHSSGRPGGDLTAAQILVACENMGIDLTCGNCAGRFYTGTGLGPHTCDHDYEMHLRQHQYDLCDCGHSFGAHDGYGDTPMIGRCKHCQCDGQSVGVL